MALYTRNQFCELTSINHAYLTTYIKRGKIKVNEHDLIDDTIRENSLFIKKKIGTKYSPIIADDDDEETVKNPENDIYIKKNNDQYELNIIKTKIEIKKKNEEYEKIKLQNSKIRGEVVPSELIKPVFLQHNQSIMTAFKNASDEMLRLISKKKGLSLNETAELSGELTVVINTAIDKANKASVKAIDNIISEHSETKGVGEHG